ncbi:MAG: Spy/CpxP family protein refolding chaperone, partial [Gemmatimonadales bacterium]
GGYDAGTYQNRLANGLPDSLKLSSDQQTAIRALITAFETSTKADRDALQSILRRAREGGRASAPGILAEAAAIIARLQAAETKLKSDIDTILTADQRAWLASHTPRNCRPERFPALTDAQKAQISALEQAFQDKNKADLDAVKAAFDSAKGKSREEAERILQGTAAARARLEAARKALRESIVGLLTAEQKASGCLPLG